MSVRVKICGLKEPRDVAAAIEAGAAYIGFNHIEISPRYLNIESIRHLAGDIPPGIAKIVLVMDPSDALLDALSARVPFDMIQLHGHESPARVAEVRARLGLPVIKAHGVRDAADMEALGPYFDVADQILVDAKPAPGGMTGGNGVTFDWRLVANRRWPKPWMLAGGLTPENVAEAIALTGASQVDVSSGVESAQGVKDAAKIRAFIAAAKGR
ncbi:MAG: phosphoribosylanthranilate isomerase [Deltaproteobacteria bacterium]